MLGCVYLNTFYNAKELYREAEEERLAGRDSALAERYGEVIDKARKAYLADQDGSWADDALLLIAQSQLRRGELEEAQASLSRVLSVSEDLELRSAAILYRGASAVLSGESGRGVFLLDGALASLQDDRRRAEGHLWRARGLLQQGLVDPGWRDLDQAEAAHGSYVVAAGLERVVWGIALGDSARILDGIQTLFFTSRAREHGDSIQALLLRVSERWGPRVAVDFMVNLDRAHWSRSERDRLLLTRASLSFESGDTTAAVGDLERVGGGVGELAATARVALARWRLTQADQLADLAQVRTLLLPAVASVEAQTLLNGIRRVELLVDYGLDGERVAFFGAAEMMRDVLGSRRLASAFFEVYSALDSASPWSGKALLAAKSLVARPSSRSSLDDRLGTLRENPYVRYTREGEGSAELSELEETLDLALSDLLERAEAQLVARRLLVGPPSG
jgi:hypothetical protein